MRPHDGPGYSLLSNKKTPPLPPLDDDDLSSPKPLDFVRNRMRERAAVDADRLTFNTQRDLDARRLHNQNKTVDASDSVEPFGDTLKHSLDNDEDYILTIKAMASIMRNHSCACNCQASRDVKSSSILRTTFWTFVGVLYFCISWRTMQLSGATMVDAADSLSLTFAVTAAVAMIQVSAQIIKAMVARR